MNALQGPVTYEEGRDVIGSLHGNPSEGTPRLASDCS